MRLTGMVVGQGCFIGCAECDHVSGRRQTDLCGSGMKATINDPMHRSVNRAAAAGSEQDICTLPRALTVSTRPHELTATSWQIGTTPGAHRGPRRLQVCVGLLAGPHGARTPLRLETVSPPRAFPQKQLVSLSLHHAQNLESEKKCRGFRHQHDVCAPWDERDRPAAHANRHSLEDWRKRNRHVERAQQSRRRSAQTVLT